MIQPTFGFKQGGKKGVWGRRLTNWRKHMLYGGAAVLGAGTGVLAAHLQHHYGKNYDPESGVYMSRTERAIRAESRARLATHGPSAGHLAARQMRAAEHAQRHGPTATHASPR